MNSTVQAVVVIAAEAFHLRLLWISPLYLSLCRRLIFPVRKPLVALVWSHIARVESIRKETPTLYFDLSTVKCTEGNNAASDLLQSLRPSVRRRYKQMEYILQQNNIRHHAFRSEQALNLSHVVPIMLQHKKRCSQADGKSVVVEFLKRFLVVTMTTDSVLDLYFTQDEELCCVQLSAVHGHVIHWSMYFYVTSSSRCGIWYHGILNAMVRGLHIPSIRYVNAQVHQTASKRSTGLVACEHTNDETLSKQYPLALSEEIPYTAFYASCWSSLKRETRATPNDTSNCTSKTKQC